MSQTTPWSGTKAAVKMTDEAGVATAMLTLEAGGADAMVEAVSMVGAEVTIATANNGRAEVGRLVGFSVGTTEKGAIVVAVKVDGPRTLDLFVGRGMLSMTARQPALIGGLAKAVDGLRLKDGTVTVSSGGRSVTLGPKKE